MRSSLVLVAVLVQVFVVGGLNGEETCLFESTQEDYTNCFDTSAAQGQECAACSVKSIDSLLQYHDYYFLEFQSLNLDEDSCEAAVEYICPEADRGKCCVLRGSFSHRTPFRRICGKPISNTTSNDTIKFDEKIVQDLLSGNSFALLTSYNLAVSTLYIHGRWTMGNIYRVEFEVETSTFSTTQVRFVFDLIANRIEMTIPEVGTLASNNLILHDTAEEFQISFRFAKGKWEV
jgi:hypothetical protein